MQFREAARAKINLTLTVLGRRPDGYHDIESLVAFAEVADRVTLVPGPEPHVTVSGPFGGEIIGENLLARALDLLRACDSHLTLGAVRLVKNLPVAAGLGGGSADAAALLRAVQRANPQRAGRVRWRDVAAGLGADVSVCLLGATSLISGVGEKVQPAGPVPGLAGAGAVLVNPRQPLPTAAVYRALGAGPRIASRDRPPVAAAPTFPDLASLIDYMRERGNDLERPAVVLLPVIAEVKAALAARPGCLLAAMSGSGPTCFGLFADNDTAAQAAAALAHEHPGWWVVATRLGEDDMAHGAGT
jgi:4-diphosphocytidyl-2-C-methyl-D-erythritol kinase